MALCLRHREKLEEALTHGGGGRTFEGLMGDVIRGDAQVFADEEGIVLSQICDEEAGFRSIHIWVCAGELEAVMEQTDRAIEWGRRVGAKIATTIGRRGWERLPAVKARAWRPDLTYYVKEI